MSRQAFMTWVEGALHRTGSRTLPPLPRRTPTGLLLSIACRNIFAVSKACKVGSESKLEPTPSRSRLSFCAEPHSRFSTLPHSHSCRCLVGLPLGLPLGLTRSCVGRDGEQLKSYLVYRKSLARRFMPKIWDSAARCRIMLPLCQRAKCGGKGLNGPKTSPQGTVRRLPIGP